VVDNLKAAVIKADWYDPDLNPKIRSFCEHYGTVILPTKPARRGTRARSSGSWATRRTMR
jgi:transposase